MEFEAAHQPYRLPSDDFEPTYQEINQQCVLRAF
ncbi:hypothetical protein Lepto7375DRAFT_7700 [Leptolyngbya sp. PCC 7375]|nr:hypothetical protein Lepto7375DRAFT_7700 [Leptolyngbya sp. PCC 7375]